MAKRRSSQTGSADPLALILLGIGAFFLFHKKPAGAASFVTPGPYRPTGTPRASTTTQVTAGSEYIRWVQRTLNQVQGSNLIVDGLIGPLTKDAIMRFQRTWDISIDGIVGPETDYYLRSALGMPGYIEQPYGGTKMLPSGEVWY